MWSYVKALSERRKVRPVSAMLVCHGLVRSIVLQWEGTYCWVRALHPAELFAVDMRPFITHKGLRTALRKQIIGWV